MTSAEHLVAGGVFCVLFLHLFEIGISYDFMETGSDLYVEGGDHVANDDGRDDERVDRTDEEVDQHANALHV